VKMSERIRVLHLVESLEVGGMENGVVNIANQIDYSCFDFMICCFSKKGDLAKRLSNQNTKVLELNYGPGIHPEAVFSLARLFKRNKIHVVHTHGWGAKSLVGLLGAKLAGTPICINGEHGVLYVEKWNKLLIQRIIARMFDHTLSVSEGLKIKLINRLGLNGKDITVIPNGVDTNKFHGNYPTEDLRKELNLKNSDFIVGVIGTLKEQKNQQIVIKALSEIRQKDYNLKLLLIGDGPDEAFLQKLVTSLGITEDVLFLGFRDDIPELLSLMDVIVLSSILDHEGMSNVILEAMASKVPVISTVSIGSKELIQDGETGLFFRHDQPSDLADKIILLKDNNGLRKAIITKAKKKILKDHTIDIMVKRYEDYYRYIFQKT